MTSTFYSKYQSAFILIAGLFIITACNKGDDDANSQLVASAGEDINVQTGLEVVLDGKGSTDLDGNPFEYSWRFISTPVSSNAVLANIDTESPSFIPDIQGKYKIELTIFNASEDRDTVLVSAFRLKMVDGNYENIIPGTNVGIRDFAVAGGYLFATCEFSEIGGIPAEKIAAYDGTAWSALGCGLEEGSIYEMIEYRGELYVTGNFDQIGCIPANNIARWNIETNSWSEVEAGLTGGTNPFGYTLVIFNDELYVGGQFEKAGDVNAINIAKWNGSEWSPVGNMEGGSVRELVVFKQRLYAGGFFNAVNGLNTGHLASYDGNNWHSPGSLNELELKTTGVVRHMAVYKEVLYISGNFEVDNVEFSELITWDGNQFNDFGTAFSLSENTISELTVIGDNLYIGGSFMDVVGSEANNILQWDGESWGIMSEGISGTVLSIELYGEEIYIGGDFRSAGGNAAENISIWNEL
jgi:trimeric autotransporter adhesin